uniref:hypothetical protein n=1 Tax=Bacillus pumilus TaxID=1408 RepID=UPI001C93194D
MTKKNYKDRNRNTQRHTDYEYSRFASTSAYTNKGNNSRATSLVGVRESQLKTMLQEPSKNAPKIAELSISGK